MPIFNHDHPKIIRVTFGFAEFLSTCQKSVYSVNFFLRYSQILNPVIRVPAPITDHAHPWSFWSTFNFYESVSTYKK